MTEKGEEMGKGRKKKERERERHTEREKERKRERERAKLWNTDLFENINLSKVMPLNKMNQSERLIAF